TPAPSGRYATPKADHPDLWISTMPAALNGSDSSAVPVHSGVPPAGANCQARSGLAVARGRFLPIWLHRVHFLDGSRISYCAWRDAHLSWGATDDRRPIQTGPRAPCVRDWGPLSASGAHMGLAAARKFSGGA